MPMDESDRENIIEAMRPRINNIIENMNKCFELEKIDAAKSYACYIESFMDFVDGIKKEKVKLDAK